MLDSVARLLKDRIIVLGSPVDDQLASVIVTQMRFLEQEDPEQAIRLYINSPGGGVEAGLAIYDTLQMIKPDVVTVCMGLAAGMAAVLLAAGTPGRRLALPDSRIVLTPGAVAVPGALPASEGVARDALRLISRVTEILARHAGQPFEQVTRDTERDFSMTAYEARAYGIVDEILERRRPPGQRSSSE